jgi:hypothetical protein
VRPIGEPSFWERSPGKLIIKHSIERHALFADGVTGRSTSAITRAPSGWRPVPTAQ